MSEETTTFRGFSKGRHATAAGKLMALYSVQPKDRTTCLGL